MILDELNKKKLISPPHFILATQYSEKNTA